MHAYGITSARARRLDDADRVNIVLVLFLLLDGLSLVSGASATLHCHQAPLRCCMHELSGPLLVKRCIEV
jgi:hypothetical protein